MAGVLNSFAHSTSSNISCLLLGFMKINSQTFKILVKSYLIKDYVNMIIDLIQKMWRERDGDDIPILTL